MDKKILRILLKHYTKISYKGGIAKVVFDNKFEDIADEVVKLCALDVVSDSVRKELERRQQAIIHEPNGIVRETMIGNLLIDL